MNTIRYCTTSNTSFTLSAEEVAFFGTNNLPLPTLCPDERNKRRMSWRNDRTFYRRTCDLDQRQMVSIYPEQTHFPVYHPSNWWSDSWDAMEYGQPYHFERSFFEQWNELFQKVPRLGIDIVNCENSDFCNYCGDNKNCYLDIAGEGNEDCMYNLFTKHSKDCCDCTFAYNSELCYECIHCYQSRECTFGKYIDNCHNCHFSFDLKGCTDCFLSYNLRKQKYVFRNQQLSANDYHTKIKEFRNGSYQTQQLLIAEWKQMMKQAIHRDMYNLNSEHCFGNNIKNSKNCWYSFNISGSEDCRYLYDVLDAKDCQDMNYSLYQPESSYEIISTLAMKFSAFCMASHYCNECFYSDLCNNSSNLFGCIGLNQKKHCILNKQYSPVEYLALKERIIKHMKQTGEWGEFFPTTLSPFPYKSTVAHEYFPQTETHVEMVIEDQLSIDQQLHGEKQHIYDQINDYSFEDFKTPAVCILTGKAFRIIPMEFSLYQKMNLPLPRLHPDQRHKQRASLRNPRRLWERACMTSQVPILTSFAPQRNEKVVCEDAYLKELY